MEVGSGGAGGLAVVLQVGLQLVESWDLLQPPRISGGVSACICHMRRFIFHRLRGRRGRLHWRRVGGVSHGICGGGMGGGSWPLLLMMLLLRSGPSGRILVGPQALTLSAGQFNVRYQSLEMSRSDHMCCKII